MVRKTTPRGPHAAAVLLNNTRQETVGAPPTLERTTTSAMPTARQEVAHTPRHGDAPRSVRQPVPVPMPLRHIPPDKTCPTRVRRSPATNRRRHGQIPCSCSSLGRGQASGRGLIEDPDSRKGPHGDQLIDQLSANNRRNSWTTSHLTPPPDGSCARNNCSTRSTRYSRS